MESILFRVAYMAPGFLMAIVFHEFAHAWMALRFGDDTAKRSGRLSLNPVDHYDLFGTVLFPLIGVLAGFAAIGWAKPVPINIRNFKNVKKGVFWVSFAGPLANIILGTLSALIFAILQTKVSRDFVLYDEFLFMSQYSIIINFVLAAFNLIPLPPLDGSQMLSTFLNPQQNAKLMQLGQYSFFIFLGAMMLSYAGIPTFHYIINPMLSLGNSLVQLFMNIL